MKGELEEVAYHENEVRTRDGRRRLIGWHNMYVSDEQGICGVVSSGQAGAA